MRGADLREVKGPFVAALARAMDSDVEKALKSLHGAEKPYLHLFMSVSPQFLEHVLKEKEADALRNLSRCVRSARAAKVRVQFSLSEPRMHDAILRDPALLPRPRRRSSISPTPTGSCFPRTWPAW